MICKEEKFVLEKCALESTNIDEKKTVSKLNGKKKVSFDQEVKMLDGYNSELYEILSIDDSNSELYEICAVKMRDKQQANESTIKNGCGVPFCDGSGNSNGKSKSHSILKNCPNKVLKSISESSKNMVKIFL